MSTTMYVFNGEIRTHNIHVHVFVKKKDKTHYLAIPLI